MTSPIVTTKGKSAFLLDLPTSRVQIFSRARSASGRFFMFSAAKASERAKAGNEKRRTLRKSTFLHTN